MTNTTFIGNGLDVFKQVQDDFTKQAMEIVKGGDVAVIRYDDDTKTFSVSKSSETKVKGKTVIAVVSDDSEENDRCKSELGYFITSVIRNELRDAPKLPDPLPTLEEMKKDLDESGGGCSV